MLVKNSKCNTLIDLPWNQRKFDEFCLKLDPKDREKLFQIIKMQL